MTIISTRFSSYALFKRLLAHHVLRYRRKLLFAVLCMAIAAAMTAFNAYMMQPVLDDVFIERNKTALFMIPIILCSIALINAFATYGQALTMRYVGQRILADMQIELFGHLMKSDLSLFHDQASGRLISRFTNDIQMMRYAVSSALVTLTREVLSMIFLVAVMLWQSWELTLIAALVFPLPVWFVTRLSKRMRKIADGIQIELGDFTAQLDEVFQAVRTVKAYNREEYEAERARNRIEKLTQLYFKASRIQAGASPLMEALSGFAIAAVVGYGGAQVIAGETTAGAFFSFITAFLLAYRPIKALAGLNTTVQEGLSAANRFFNAIDTIPRVGDRDDAVKLEVRRGEVEFKNVSFRYAPDAGGVERVSFTVAPGQKVALVGHSGGGKSTLFNLLLRFYDVEEGAILVDGTDIRAITQNSLREAIALVPQESMLFDDTVRANIAYGRMNVTEEEVRIAARAAHAEEFIERLPKGYDTIIGPNGVKLSGGQRQRISIARAMLKNAPILLLDEATSSLDNTSERAVQEALARLMQGRATLIIAHRLSTVKHADLIYVIEHGRVVESGTHDSLLSRGGAYHRLYAEQLAHAS